MKYEMNLPDRINTTEELDHILSRPDPALVAAMHALPGDLMLLGAGGKMGVTLALLAKGASEAAGRSKKIIAVSRFSSPAAQNTLQAAGIETISCDLLEPQELNRLPEVQNVIYMVGMKFGATSREAETWAVNAFLPGAVAAKFKSSKIVVFSTGNVYPLVPVAGGGCKETDPTGPIGEYAQSALARERVFSYFSKKYNIPGVIIRLNYAIDLRYGVLLDIAQKVYRRQPVDVTMGYCNVIWQGDANAITLRSFAKAQTPPLVLNVTGREIVSIRALATRFGELFGITPIFQGREADTALLSDARLCCELFGRPNVSLEQMIAWIAHWVAIGGATLQKPTHFEVRDGKF